jgi:hypothetical protein
MNAESDAPISNALFVHIILQIFGHVNWLICTFVDVTALAELLDNSLDEVS